MDQFDGLLPNKPIFFCFFEITQTCKYFAVSTFKYTRFQDS